MTTRYVCVLEREAKRTDVTQVLGWWHPHMEDIMIKKQENSKIPEIQAVDTLPYDSKPLATALAALSPVEIESMLGQISSLETQIARLNIRGHEDAMMQMVTDGLRRLTYFLDMVKRHQQDGRTNDEQTTPTVSI